MKPPQNIFYASDRNEWRRWLEAHFEVENEVWFVFPTKASGEPALAYNDAVEEALCFGWIDSTARQLDELHQLRRFTPRRKGSPYSRPNIERLMWLNDRGKLHPSVREAVLPIISEPYRFPDDIIEALREHPVAWQFYSTLSPSYCRIRIAYIDAARHRPAEFAKRLAHFIAKCSKRQLIIGYGGVDKYYNKQ